MVPLIALLIKILQPIWPQCVQLQLALIVAVASYVPLLSKRPLINQEYRMAYFCSQEGQLGAPGAETATSRGEGGALTPQCVRS